MRAIATSAVIAAALAGCSATPGADMILALPEPIQVRAYQQCQSELGLAGDLPLQRLPLDDGRVSVFAANGNGTSLGQARQLNQCATNTLNAAYGVGDDIFAFSAEQQGDAILECKNERGIPGNFTTEAFQYGSAAQEVLIVPAFAVTETDARAINACARGKLRGLGTASFAQTSNAAAPTSSAVPQQVAPRRNVDYRAEVLSGAIGPNFAAAGCIPGRGTFQRGTLICPGN